MTTTDTANPAQTASETAEQAAFPVAVPTAGARPAAVRPGRDFGRLLSAYSVQTIGEGVLIATLPLLASQITSDPRLVSGVGLAQELPWLLLALPGGLITDRFDRRRLMISTQAAQGLLLAVIAVLAWAHVIQIWMLFVLAFALGSGDILFTGATQAVIPALVPDAALDRANGRYATAQTVGRQFVGPPLGAALFAFLMPLPFWFDATTYLLSLLLLLRIRNRDEFRPAATATAEAVAGAPVDSPAAEDKPRAGWRDLFAEATEGLRLIARHPVLRAIVVLAAASNFCVYMAEPLLVLFARKVLHVGPSGYGLLISAMAVGGVIGALLSHRVVDRFGARAVALTVSVAGALSLVAIGFLADQVVVMVGLFGVWSAGLSLWNVMAQSVSQRLVPNELKGRVSTSSRMICFGALPLGALAGGLIADSSGLRAPWIIGGLLNLAITLCFVPTMLRWPTAGDAAAEAPTTSPVSAAVEGSDR